eukprot:CAMPEP_0113705052 /NCGR_PEP_ID=MMETSP0038_2-20120614/26901_1 /TAXON_ID=2898 /ORGANISM="Cryptomonas paramecium" /LENGTH=366 /DNA_ID=CAMNT_0000629983 /DNA_START=436 /DNA_END=1538 /DNA_ORIENTATION=- /assembly_acc=CAM_ASM_000170
MQITGYCKVAQARKPQLHRKSSAEGWSAKSTALSETHQQPGTGLLSSKARGSDNDDDSSPWRSPTKTATCVTAGIYSHRPTAPAPCHPRAADDAGVQSRRLGLFSEPDGSSGGDAGTAHALGTQTSSLNKRLRVLAGRGAGGPRAYSVVADSSVAEAHAVVPPQRHEVVHARQALVRVEHVEVVADAPDDAEPDRRQLRPELGLGALDGHHLHPVLVKGEVEERLQLRALDVHRHVVDVARRAHVAQHLGDGDGRHLHGVSCVGGHRVVRGAGDDARQAGMPIGAARVVGRVLPIRQQAVNHTASTVAQAPQLPVPGLHADPVPVVVELQRQRVAVVNGLERAHVDEEAAAGEAQQPHHVHGLNRL